MDNNSFVTTVGYFPPIEYLAFAATGEQWILEAHENYQKSGFRNKCRIMSSQGVATLSVPLEKGRGNRLPIREVKISNTQNWRRQHWQTIRTNYGKSPFFIHYAQHFEAFFAKEHKYLLDLCTESTMLLLRLLKIEAEPVFTEAFIREYPNPPVTDLRSTGRDPNPELFTPVPYPQVFQDRHGFVPNLSAMDLLFCLGTDAKKILKKCKNMYL